MQDDVSAGGRASEPDDSLSHMDCPKTAAFLELYQFVADEPDFDGFHAGRGDLQSASVPNQAPESVNDLSAPALAAEVGYPSSPKCFDRLRTHVFDCAVGEGS